MDDDLTMSEDQEEKVYHCPTCNTEYTEEEAKENGMECRTDEGVALIEGKAPEPTEEDDGEEWEDDEDDDLDLDED